MNTSQGPWFGSVVWAIVSLVKEFLLGYKAEKFGIGTTLNRDGAVSPRISFDLRNALEHT